MKCSCSSPRAALIRRPASPCFQRISFTSRGSFDILIAYPPLCGVDNFLSISHEEVTARPSSPPSGARISPHLPLELYGAKPLFFPPPQVQSFGNIFRFAQCKHCLMPSFRPYQALWITVLVYPDRSSTDCIQQGFSIS